MIKALKKIISKFSGAPNQACCLAHIVNLISKLILQNFDVSKKKYDGEKDETDQENNETDDLASLGADLEREEKEIGEKDKEIDDDFLVMNVEAIEEALEGGASDEVAKQKKLVQHVLVKVSSYLNLIIIHLNHLIIPYHHLTIPYCYPS